MVIIDSLDKLFNFTKLNDQSDRVLRLDFSENTAFWLIIGIKVSYLIRNYFVRLEIWDIKHLVLSNLFRLLLIEISF